MEGNGEINGKKSDNVEDIIYFFLFPVADPGFPRWESTLDRGVPTYYSPKCL